jgi:hypothetical protein
MAAVSVQGFVDEVAAAGWQYGERDCLLWLGEWARRNTGVDGGAPWRGRYKTALGCARVLKRSGGMLACIERGAALAGMVETTAPVAGAVGLVEVMTARGAEVVGAIFTGRRWAVLTASGVVTVTATPARAWNLP